MVIELALQRFGRLQVLWETTESRGGNRLWLCECDCGKIVRVGRQDLQGGKTRSCGCLNREKATEHMRALSKKQYKHGDTINGKSTKLFSIWSTMRSRCYRKHATGYEWYGKKGIIICPTWRSDYATFKKWALDNGYKEGLSIDRINSGGNYEPDNCQWLTKSGHTKKQWRDYRALEERKIEVSI